MKIDSESNLTRLKRRFIAADEAFTKRFIATKNKHLSVRIMYSNCQFNCQINEKATESKIVDIDYQDLHSTEAETTEKTATIL